MRTIFLPETRTLAAHARRIARRLELRSCPLLQEQFSAQEGLRAGVAIALPLAAAMLSGQRWLAWAVFAAFWTCLCDAPGPHAQRRLLLGIFALAGTVVAFIGAWSSSWTPHAALLTAPLMVLGAVTLTGAIESGALLGTLLAVVAVVAAGFPQGQAMAALQAASFCAGALWAWLLINLIWRIDDQAALRQAARAALLRMLDMSQALLASPAGQHRDQHWHREHGEHRRATRLALERLRAMLLRHAGTAMADAHTWEHLLQASEMIFHTLIALEHAAIQQLTTPHEQRRAARLALAVLLRAHARLEATRGMPPGRALQERFGASQQAPVSDPLVAGCLRALSHADRLLWAEQRSREVAETAPTPPRNPLLPQLHKSLQQGGRQAAGVGAVFYAAQAFHLGYPYWATMAVVVVLQGAARQTWARCVERILGSLLGGLLALTLLQLVPPHGLLLPLLAILLAGLAIALRLVNYTVFVVFLTMLFICVTDMLQPGAGIASARALDNLVGSGAALLAALALWPDLGATPRQRIAAGLEANRAYLDAVLARQPAPVLRQLQRQAGLASIDAETALHELGGLRRQRDGLTSEEVASLRSLRELAGQASVQWHRQHADGRSS